MNNIELRDYFAAQAMQGLLASFSEDYMLGDRELAEKAYDIADVMTVEYARRRR